MTKVEIPSKPVPPHGSLHDCKQLWYGLEKIGKTTLAAQFPDPIFLMTEPGAGFIAVRRVTVDSWTIFLAVLRMLRSEEVHYKTIVVDTVDNLYGMCRAHVCEKLGIEHPTDAPYGKGWDGLRTEFARAIGRLANLPGGLIFISHARITEVRRRGGASFSRTQSTMGKAEEVVKPLVDIYGYYEYSELGRRVMHVAGDDLVSAGHRCVGHFQGVRAIPMGASPRQAYERFVAAFNNELKLKGEIRPEAQTPVGR